jgi:hypothetical protein
MGCPLPAPTLEERIRRNAAEAQALVAEVQARQAGSAPAYGLKELPGTKHNGEQET